MPIPASRGEVSPMPELPNDLVAAIDDLLVEVDSDDMEDEVETAERAISW